MQAAGETVTDTQIFWYGYGLRIEICCNISILDALEENLTVSFEDDVHPVTRTVTSFPLASL